MSTSRPQLSRQERDRIAILTASGHTCAETADLLGRHRTTIARELARGAEPNGAYLPGQAQLRAERRRQPSQGRPRLLDTPAGQALVEGLVRLAETCHYSVRQGLAQLAAAGQAVVCAETVYRWLYRVRGGVARRLRHAMVRPRRHRMPRSAPRSTRGRIVGMVGLGHRPADAEGRKVPGHWEGDLIVGAGGKTALITLVDRCTRTVRVLPTRSRGTADVRGMLTLWAASEPLPVASLTWDQGKELASHAALTAETGVPVFFADAHSPWQRGSNENTNGVLRRFWPKGTALPADPRVCDVVAGWLNSRLMPTLSGRSPVEVSADYGLCT